MRHEASAAADLGVYKPRRPQASPLFRLVSDHVQRLQTVYDDRFAREYGPWRHVVAQVTDNPRLWHPRARVHPPAWQTPPSGARPRPPRPWRVARMARGADRPRAPRPSTRPEVPERRLARPGSLVGAVWCVQRSQIGPEPRGDGPRHGRPDDRRRRQTSPRPPRNRTRAPRAACRASPYFHNPD